MTGTSVTLFVLKVSVLVAAALLAAYLLRRAPAARRHGLWSAAFVALVALPPLALMLPALRVPVPAWHASESVTQLTPHVGAVRPSDVQSSAGSPDISVTARVSAADLSETPIRLPSLRTTIVGLWLAGVVAALLSLLVSLIRVRHLAASGDEIDDAEWRAAGDRITRRLGLTRRVRIVAASTIATPMAGGFVHPTVFVPADALSWSVERRDIVLAHEIAHLANRDPLRLLISRVAFTLYWFHPLVWLAVRHSTTDCEQACDESVLALGFRPSTYARVLLDFADAPVLAHASAALPMIRRARLESRLMTILNASPRPSVRHRAVLPTVVAAALTLSIAAAEPAAVAARVGVDAGAGAAPVIYTPDAKPAAEVKATASAPLVKVAPTMMTSLEGSCWSDRDMRSFSGSTSMSGSIVYERIGRTGSDRVIQKSFGDLRICMTTDGFNGDYSARPSDWTGHAPRVVLETARPGDVRRMEIDGGRTTWTINGQARPYDVAAGAWRDGLLALLDATWDVSQLRGQVSTLRGEISTIRGDRSTLLGEISTFKGEVSTMYGEISTLKGEESSLRGEISSIRGHVSSLQGKISSERGAISSLQASRSYTGSGERSDIDARIRRHEETIRDVEDEIDRYNAVSRIREVERRIDALETEPRVRDIERRIGDFDLDGKVAAVNRRLAELQVESRVDGIEHEIMGLDANDRVRELEVRRDAALARLRATLGR